VGTFTIEKLPDEPIIVAELVGEEWDLGVLYPPFVEQFIALLDSLDEPVYYIGHAPNLDMSYLDVMLMANMLVIEAFFVHYHPNLKGLLAVGKGELLGQSTEGTRRAFLGHLSLSTFDTFEEALESARAKVAGEQGD
jgi:hypothetical protein